MSIWKTLENIRGFFSRTDTCTYRPKKDSPKTERKSIKGGVAPSKEAKGPNSMQEKAAKLGLYN